MFPLMAKHGRRYWLVVPFVVLTVLLAACAANTEETTATTTTTAAPAATTTSVATTNSVAPDTTAGNVPSGEPIRIGGTLGLTGAFAGPSADYKVYYEAAAADLNARGGLLGRPVELILYDDESTQATAQALYERLVGEDNVDILLAPYTTFIGGSIVPIAKESGKVLVNAGFTGWEIARLYDRIFYTWTIQEPTYTKPFFDWLASLPEADRPQKMALLVAQNPFTIMERDGSGGELGVLNFAKDLGIEVVVNEEYAGGITDASPLLQKAKDAEADLLVVLGLPQDSILMARTAAEVGFEPAFYCTCGSTMTAFPVWQDLGAAGDYVFANAPAWSSDDFPGMTRAVEIANDLGYAEMPPYAPMTLAAFQVLEQAVNGAGTVEPEALASYMYDNTFSTAVGEISFDEYGIPIYYGSLLQVQDGKNVKIWPLESATATGVYPRP
jgi:branched-chain amino acid transport system substrate-binding protein